MGNIGFERSKHFLCAVRRNGLYHIVVVCKYQKACVIIRNIANVFNNKSSIESYDWNSVRDKSIQYFRVFHATHLPRKAEGTNFSLCGTRFDKMYGVAFLVKLDRVHAALVDQLRPKLNA